MSPVAAIAQKEICASDGSQKPSCAIPSCPPNMPKNHLAQAK